MRRSVVLLLVLLVGCAVSPKPEDKPATLPAGRYQLVHGLGDGALYRLDTATGETCFLQNLANPKVMVGASRFGAEVGALKPDAIDAFFARNESALFDDCVGP